LKQDNAANREGRQGGSIASQFGRDIDTFVRAAGAIASGLRYGQLSLGMESGSREDGVKTYQVSRSETCLCDVPGQPGRGGNRHQECTASQRYRYDIALCACGQKATVRCLGEARGVLERVA